MFYNSNAIRACIDVDPSILFLKKYKRKSILIKIIFNNVVICIINVIKKILKIYKVTVYC